MSRRTKRFLILQATPPAYFAGLKKGAVTWTPNPKKAQVFETKIDAAETARALRRLNGYKPAQAYLVVPAGTAIVQDGS